MKHLAPLGRLAVAVLACVAADGTWALSIGRAQGAPLVGRPLEVSVPVQFDPGTDASSHCAAVEVFYGDNRLAADRVTTDLQTGATTSTLRVRTLAPVDEPVVTLYLHIGCQGRLTRRVVLLADHPDPLAEPLPRAVATPGLTPVLPLPPAAARRLEPGGTGPAAGGSARSAAPSAAGRSAVALARPAPVAPAREAAALARGRTADRLRLDASDRAASGAAVLRLSTDMGRPADGGGQQRALAAAIWRALNATPEELLRDTQRLQALEGELRGLRTSVQRNDAAIATLRDDLVRARAERWANPLVYGLAALALLATALAALAWRRARGEPGRPWWRPAATTAGSRQDDHSPSALREGGVEPTAFEAHDPGPPADSAAPAGASGERAARAEGGADPAPSGFGDSILGPRSVRAEEVRDVQQEADFFFSLGEHERAIEVLRNHIAANPDTSAVAWLDLLDILHRTGQRQEFQWLREDFERTFHVDVPEFDAYTEGEGPDLEAYPEALERITAVWPSTQVLDHIEEAVFRRPRLGADAPMSLGAYRDLLMLHHLCEEVLSRAATARVTGAAFAPMATQVLRTVHAAEAADTRPEADGPGAARADLDFNLDDAAPEPDLLIGGPPSVQPQDNLLDFDLPDIDTTAMRPKKTRE